MRIIRINKIKNIKKGEKKNLKKYIHLQFLISVIN